MTLSWTPITPSRLFFRSSIRDDRFGFLFDFPSHARWRPGAAYRSRPNPGDPDADLRNAAQRWSARLFSGPKSEGTLPAAATFLGQFVAHDLSFDARTVLRASADPVPNHRTPRLDLDSLYGAGPIASPQYYQGADRRLFAIGSNGGAKGSNPSRPEPDLLRSPETSADWEFTNASCRRRTAIVPDPRNDDNTVVAQLHLAFQLFHNRIVQQTNCSFEAAQYAVRHAYHRIVWRDLIVPLCGPDVTSELLRSGEACAFRHFRRRGFVPYEFAMALFRFGHAMVGEAYHLNDDLEARRRGAAIRLTREDLSTNRDRDRMAHAHLDGGRVLPPRWTIQWDRFLQPPSRANGSRVPNDAVGLQKARAIDPRISPPLAGLPIEAEARVERSLPYRTLLRGSLIGLPTGAWVAARVVGARNVLPPLDPEEPDPLWVYVLREAAEQPVPGGQLGPVAARLVGEVCFGLLSNDPENGLASAAPEPVVSLGPEPGLGDLIAFAGLPISRDDWVRLVELGG